jgi:hypothetical protein
MIRYKGRGRPPKPPLELRQVLAWADAHFRRTGTWPRPTTGGIPEGPGETWRGIDLALRLGRRGLSGGSSLTRLLERERGAQVRRGRPPSAKARQAARLREQGLTLAAIGQRLGVTWQAVQQLLRRAQAG